MAVAVGLAMRQYLEFGLTHIQPNQELEEVVTSRRLSLVSVSRHSLSHTLA
jgi:Arc/MetJ family transcription regulator